MHVVRHLDAPDMFSHLAATPRISPRAFIAPNAVVLGDVVVEDEASAGARFGGSGQRFPEKRGPRTPASSFTNRSRAILTFERRKEDPWAML